VEVGKLFFGDFFGFLKFLQFFILLKFFKFLKKLEYYHKNPKKSLPNTSKKINTCCWSHSTILTYMQAMKKVAEIRKELHNLQQK
jgi:hypothetical protein